MEVRSYRRVFDLERRIYRIDRLRLNPGGVPVRGVVYLLAIVAAALLAARLPLIGVAVRGVPWFVRDLAFPGLTAALLAVVRIEGRPFHLAARALLCFRARVGVPIGMRVENGVRAHGTRWSPPPLLMLPDGCGGPRRLRYTGPGALLVGMAHECESARGPLVGLGLRPDVRVRESPGRVRPASGSVILLDRGARLDVR